MHRIAVHKNRTSKHLETSLDRYVMPQLPTTLYSGWRVQIFADVDMLYVEFEVNRHKAAAFVDSGAQKTIIGLQTAQVHLDAKP